MKTATIGTAIRLTDMMTAPLRNITNAMNMMLSTWTSLEGATSGGLDVGDVEAIRSELNKATSALDQMGDEQGEFNRKVHEGASATDGLTNKIMCAVGAFVGLQSIGKLVNLSDNFTQTYARLDMINDGAQNTDELFDKIAASASRARASISTTADTVAKLSLNAGDAFSSNDETILFAENLNKLFVIAGTEQASIASASLQLTQALGSGVLRGEEFNAVFEAAPNIMQTVADYMDVPIGQLRSMAQEGQITADVVKNALLSATGEINTQFESMPMTWGQVWTGVMNRLYLASIPVLKAINWMAQNWSILEPIVIGVAIAVGSYTAALLIHKAALAGTAFMEAFHAAQAAIKKGATLAEAAATTTATGAQVGFNAALMACPLTWIIVLIIAVIAVVYAVVAATNKWKNTTISATGAICGGINVVIQFFKNLGLLVANIALGIWNALGAACSNIGIAFHNVICNIQSWWYGMLSTVLTVVEGICAALNKIPFIEFDYSGISAKADEYAAKSAQAAGNKQEYKSISDAFNEGMSTFDVFQSGWVGDAYNAGYSWGEGVEDSVGGFFGSDSDTDLAEAMGDIPAYDEIANNTDRTANALEITNENLKYLRDSAEQEAVNRFTTAEVRVEMTNNNNISSNMDLDGVVDYMVTGVQEALERTAEGVHS